MNLNDQLKLEDRVVKNDAAKYYFKQDKLRTKGLGDQVDSHAFIIKDAVLRVADKLEEFATRRTKGMGGKYNALLRNVAARITKDEITYDYPAVAFIGLQAIFQGMTCKHNTWNKLAHTIAARLEADHKARLFEAHEPAYFNRVIQSFSEQQIQQYQHKQRVLMMKFNEFEIKWTPWDAGEKIQVANRILIAILDTLPDVLFRNSYMRHNKTVAIIDTTVNADEWFAEFERESGFLHPSHPPTIVPPLDWERDSSGVFTGGYHTYGLANTLPFVKTRSDAHREFISAYTMEEHRTAVNKLQNTAWKINQQVLDVQIEMFRQELGNGLPTYKPKELPDFPEEAAAIPNELWTEAQKTTVKEWKGVTKRIHQHNRLQKGKVIAYKSILDTAQEYRNYEAFYFVYNSDFRGRLYCATSGLSPQGEDLAKGLLTFGTSLETGATGLYWLAVHGANTYGNDKISNDARVEWCYEQEARFKAVISDAISTREYWGAADKPWQFLAFIFAWASTDYGKNPDMGTSLPVGLDGSCNGIQHYSALLRDMVGGRSVNLIDGTLPSDLYQDVSDVLERKLHDSSEVYAKVWLAVGINRKLTKRPVMTLPYGSTQKSCRKYIVEWMDDNHALFTSDESVLFELALYLTNKLWASIGEVVIAARDGMDWLKKVASRSIKQGRDPLTWISPAGFPVYQDYRLMQSTKVSTMIAGSIIPRIRITSQTPTKEINAFKQRSGVSPNFIHCLDASHLVKTVNACDLTHFAMIHDDFGTHAGNTEYLWNQIRVSFVQMYTEYAPLIDYQNDQDLEDKLDLPHQGELRIEDVLNSTYFFG